MPPSYRIKPKGPLAEGEPISLDNLGKFMSGSDLLHLAIKAIRLERIELNSYPKQPETNVDLQFEYNDFGRLEREEERARMLQPVRKPQVTEPGNLFTAKKWNELFPKDLRLKESIVVNNSFDMMKTNTEKTVQKELSLLIENINTFKLQKNISFFFGENINGI
jgi:hypothetical protein